MKAVFVRETYGNDDLMGTQESCCMVRKGARQEGRQACEQEMRMRKKDMCEKDMDRKSEQEEEKTSTRE